MNYQDYITIDPNKRGGKPCVRGLRITVYEVLEYLASDMTEEEILDDFPDLTREDLKACIAFAADREAQADDSAGRMKLLFDENLSYKLARALLTCSRFPSRGAIRLESRGRPMVWNTPRARPVIVSKDSDMHQRSFVFGHSAESSWCGWSIARHRR